MNVWMTIWVVFMCFWLFGGGYYAYRGPDVFSSSIQHLIPWLCVLILGLLQFGALKGDKQG